MSEPPDGGDLPGAMPWARGPVYAPTGSEAGEFDRTAIQHRDVPEAALMERAGAQAATWIHTRFRGLRGDPVLVLSGSGNNGGDALVVARCLVVWGWRVRVLHSSDSPADLGLLHDHAITRDRAEELSDEALTSTLSGAGLIIDGMLGTGARGAPRGQAGRIVGRLADLRDNVSPPLVVALDVPTGVDSDTGEVEGEAIHADVTLAFGWPKLGTLLHPGRAHAGRIVGLEIGFPPVREPFRYQLLTTTGVDPRLPRRPPVTHKNDVGSLLVIAGREGMAGAAILAARSALRAGAGYVRVASVPANRNAVQSALPEAVWVDRDDRDALEAALEASAAVAIGPGIGTDAPAAALLEAVLNGPALPTVLDADALTLLAEGGVDLPDDRPLVITPHPGEAARLLGTSAADVQADRPDALDRLRDATAAVVLLKGTPSLVAGVRRWLDPHGSSDLAAAGVGDVLTGTVGSFLAQGVEAEDAAGLALVVTALAARAAGTGPGLQSADVPEWIPRVITGPTGHPGLPVPPEPSLPWVVFDLDAAR